MDFLRLFLLSLTKSITTRLNATVNHTLACGCLKKLEISQKGVTQKQLCEILYSPKQTVNSLIASYVRRGLVETKPNSTDGRSKLHVLTAAGKEKLDAIRRDERMLGIYSLDGVSREELDQVRRVLCSIADRCTQGIAFLNANEPFPWEGR